MLRAVISGPTNASDRNARQDAEEPRGRRGVKPEDASRWVFNRIADAYAARPEYPKELIDELAALSPSNGRIGDIGAGTGNVALPLAQRGFDVVAVEPARAMLSRLRATAAERGLSVRTMHAAAEAMPLEDEHLHLAVVADALHFLDLERISRELFRVLVRRGALAIVTVEFGDTPYMQSVARIIEEASQRRPRPASAAVAALSALARVPFRPPRVFRDETHMDTETLERVLRSLSFVGPAMNSERFAAFRRRILALGDRPVWTRRITLHAGRKALRARPPDGARDR
jgi:ubiquinone/menaquinone biosynthesis C-methylase UbiE